MEGEWEGNVSCIIYRFSSMSMLCAHFPVTFPRLRKKATKQCNGEKDLQHSTIELKVAWRMKQMPRLTLTVPSLATYLCSLVCKSHVQETWNKAANQGCFITGVPLYGRYIMLDLLSSSSSHLHRPLFHLSNLMNRCCSAAGVNMTDWIAGRHIPLLRKSERGHLDSEECARVPWLFCVSHLRSSSSLPSSLTFRSLSFPSPAPCTLPPTVLSIWALVSHSVRLITYL